MDIPRFKTSLAIFPVKSRRSCDAGTWYKVTRKPSQVWKFLFYRAIFSALIVTACACIMLVDVVYELFARSESGDDGALVYLGFTGIALATVYALLLLWSLFVCLLRGDCFYVGVCPGKNRIIPSRRFKPEMAVELDRVKFRFLERSAYKPWSGIEFSSDARNMSEASIVLIKTIGAPDEIDDLYKWLKALADASDGNGDNRDEGAR